jgi:cell division protein FtsI (penicillin-binding protein 3)
MANTAQHRMRIYIVMLVFAGLFSIVAARLTDLGLAREHKNQAIAAIRMPDQSEGPRADILDRNGRLIATSLTTDSLYADPKRVIDPTATARRLAHAFDGINEKSLAEKLSGNRRFVWIKRNLTPKQKYRALSLGLPGVEFKQEYRRFYPNGDLTSHLTGYTNVDNDGLAGVERSFDHELNELKQPVRLTIDLGLQHIVHRELTRTIKRFKATAATGIIQDVKTGEILAMVSLPDFNPHEAGMAPDQAKFNRATLGVYEMGSTFKIFSTAAALESGVVRLNDRYDVRDPIRRAGFWIRDYHKHNQTLDVEQVFVRSSNIGSALMAEDTGSEAFREFYQKLGLFTPVDLPLPEVGSPLMPTPWRDINTLTAAYGHGIAVSPLQTITAASSIVGGQVIRPQITPVDRAQTGPEINAATTNAMRKMLRLAVKHDEGTGSNADIPGYQVGGKTGTAEKASSGGYHGDQLISSFLGVFPSDDPQYSILVLVDEPEPREDTYGYATGGWVAAPAVGNIIRQMGPYIGLTQMKGNAKNDKRSTKTRTTKPQRIPPQPNPWTQAFNGSN